MYSPKAQAIVLQKSLGKNVSKATTKHLSSNWTLPFENVFLQRLFSIEPRVVIMIMRAPPGSSSACSIELQFEGSHS